MFKNLTVKTRLFSLIAFFVIMLVAIGTLALKGFKEANEGFRTVYVSRAIPLAQLSEISDLNAENFILLSRLGLLTTQSEGGAQNAQESTKYLEKITQNSAALEKIWREYLAFLPARFCRTGHGFKQIMVCHR
jgi:hypothetical protein